MEPFGISILWPSEQTMMTVPLKVTSLPKKTLPVMVKWSSSTIFGMWGILALKPETFLKCEPNLINGFGPKRDGSNFKEPCSRRNRSDLTSNKSEQVLTGKNLDLGTTTPWAPSKCLIAAPQAVSNCKTLITWPSLVIVFWFGMIYISKLLDSINLFTAFRLIHKLFVLKLVNFLIFLNSSMCSFGTWATSNKRTWPS